MHCLDQTRARFRRCAPRPLPGLRADFGAVGRGDSPRCDTRHMPRAPECRWKGVGIEPSAVAEEDAYLAKKERELIPWGHRDARQTRCERLRSPPIPAGRRAAGRGLIQLRKFEKME